MKANTKEMRNIASEIYSKANDYQILISKMYRKFTDMPNGTQEWSGNKAKEYVDIILLDKDEFMKIGDELKAYGRAIAEMATLIEERASKTRKDEENG